jgi:hypothetical protein
MAQHHHTPPTAESTVAIQMVTHNEENKVIYRLCAAVTKPPIMKRGTRTFQHHGKTMMKSELVKHHQCQLWWKNL